MIWIATLCLLAIAAWLFFNALNERRWVESHSHDETVASDPGILPDLSRLTARSSTDGKVSIEQEDSPFARAVAKVREKTEKASAKIEERASRARERDDGETFFGRAVAKIGGGVNAMDDKLDARAKRASDTRGGSIAEEDSLFGRITARVDRKQEEYGRRVHERAASRAAEPTASRSVRDDGGFFGRMVNRVSGQLDRVEGKMDARAERARSADEDFMTRTSAKVGGKINEIDEKIVDKSRDAAQWVDRKTDL